ncbi:hypothetical protein CK934_08420 [Chitinophaga sp. MD30]|nr:hypothetical protein CK934_08420 [Chitinophaga sp. MD30]
MISRTVMDLPDDYTYGFKNILMPDDGANSSYNIECFGNYMLNWYSTQYPKYDAQPDIFYYSTPDVSGKFMFRNKIAPGIEPGIMLLPFSNVNIRYDVNPQSFTLLNERGDIYEFGKTANSTEKYDAGSTGSGGGGFPIGYDPKTGAAIMNPSNLNSNTNTPLSNISSAWYLTRIISADKGDTVYFKYEAAGEQSYSRITTSLTAFFSGNSLPQKSQGSIYRKETKIRISEIVNANGKVIFKYAAQNFGELAAIDILAIIGPSEYKKVKSFEFGQSFFRNAIKAPNGLRLDNVVEIGYDQQQQAQRMQPYAFSYYTDNVPTFDSNSQDFWGYYNGKLNSDLLYVKSAISRQESKENGVDYAFENREANEEMMKTASLKRITYPTGGFTAFEFEAPKAQIEETETKTVKRELGHHISTMYLNPGEGKKGTSIIFKLDPRTVMGDIRLKFTGSATCLQSSPLRECVSNSPEVRLQRADRSDVGYGWTLSRLTSGTGTTYDEFETAQDQLAGLSKDVNYELYFPYPGELTKSEQATKYRLDATLNESYYETVTTMNTISRVIGGLRIKTITHDDGTGNQIIKKYNYPEFYYNSNVFNGKFDRIVSSLAQETGFLFNLGSGTRTIEEELSINPTLSYPFVKSQKIFSESPSVSIGGASNNSVSYEKVEESQYSKDGRNLGKTVYTFRKAIDYVFNPLPNMRFDREFLRAQLLNVKVYKNDNGVDVLVKETNNVYNNLNDFDADTRGMDSVKLFVGETQIGRNFGSGTNGLFSFQNCLACNEFGKDQTMRIYPLYYHSVKPLLVSSQTTTYDTNGGNPIVLKKDYEYAGNKHVYPTRISEIDSRKRTEVVTTKYPLDYTTSNCDESACIRNFNSSLSVLVTQREACEQPVLSGVTPRTYDVAQQNFKNCQESFRQSLQTLVNQYGSCRTQYEQCYANAKASMSAENRAIASMKDLNMVADQIDVVNNISGQQTKRILTTYSDLNTAGSIVKPVQVSIQEGSGLIESRFNYINYDNRGNLTEQGKTGDASEVYLWGYKGQYPVAKIVGSNYQVARSFINQAILDNPANEGELRTELAKIREGLSGKALVTTFTFNPLIGLTSETDPTGKTIYYEYDVFMRLKLIRDMNGKVLKQIDYQYQAPIQQ